MIRCICPSLQEGLSIGWLFFFHLVKHFSITVALINPSEYAITSNHSIKLTYYWPYVPCPNLI